MADCLPGKSGSAVNADHPRAGQPHPRHCKRRDHLHHPERSGSYGPYGHPLRLQRQRRGLPAHRDFKEHRAQQLLQTVPGALQQQDQRHHIPPLAHGMQPRAFRPHHLPHRKWVEERCHGTGKTGTVRV